MALARHAICVSTTKPTASLTPGGGGGGVVIICPQTGSILSSLRAAGDNSSKSLLGMASISMFPPSFGTHNTSLMMAYGGTTSTKEDTYGMLLTLRNVSTPPLMTWKCRLPEAQLPAGLAVSPCGHYVVGGSNSGNIYVWSSFGGNFLKTVKAHYRPVTALAWSDCESYLISGGADGMVHVFSMMDLVERNTSRTVSPVRTWSAHHLTVTALQVLDGSRFVSASEDGQIVVMEIFSEATLAKIQISSGVRSLTFHDGTLFAGSTQGTIHAIDLDMYASYQTSQLGVTVKRRKTEELSEDKVFSLDNGDCFKSELRGHEKSVTALAVLMQGDTALLVSGDSRGALRLWDLKSRGCVRVVEPWSFSTRTTDTSEAAKSNGSHPIASITVVPRCDSVEQTENGTFGSSSAKESRAKSIVNLITPLKRFPEQLEDCPSSIPVPFLRPKRTKDSLALKPLLTSKANRQYDAEISRLREELEESKKRALWLEEENESLRKQAVN